jgi:hypothetical protein
VVWPCDPSGPLADARGSVLAPNRDRKGADLAVRAPKLKRRTARSVQGGLERAVRSFCGPLLYLAGGAGMSSGFGAAANVAGTSEAAD